MNVREWALPVYTILIQIASGMLLLLWSLRALTLKRVGTREWNLLLRRPVVVVLITLLAGMIGAHFHLSRPLWSVMAVLNVRTSWLSREILFTIALFLASIALAAQIWFGAQDSQRLTTALGWLGVAFGTTTIFCMGRIYQIPVQAPWNHWTTVPLFYCSSLVLGALSTAALMNRDAMFAHSNQAVLPGSDPGFLRTAILWLVGVAGFSLLLIMMMNIAQIAAARSGDDLMRTSMALLLRLYRPLLWLRFASLLVGVTWFVAVATRWLKGSRTIDELTVPVYFACLLVIVAESLGRFLFYATHVRLGF